MYVRVVLFTVINATNYATIIFSTRSQFITFFRLFCFVSSHESLVSFNNHQKEFTHLSIRRKSLHGNTWQESTQKECTDHFHCSGYFCLNFFLETFLSWFVFTASKKFPFNFNNPIRRRLTYHEQKFLSNLIFLFTPIRLICKFFVGDEKKSRLNSSEAKTKLKHENFLSKAFLLALSASSVRAAAKTTINGKKHREHVWEIADDVLWCFFSVSAPRWIQFCALLPSLVNTQNKKLRKIFLFFHLLPANIKKELLFDWKALTCLHVQFPVSNCEASAILSRKKIQIIGINQSWINVKYLKPEVLSITQRICLKFRFKILFFLL